MAAATWPIRRQLDFVLFSAVAEARAEGHRTYLGLLWWLVEPIASLAVYYFVFEILLQRGGPGFVFFLLIGLVPWRWLSTSLDQGSTAILNARQLLQLVYVPKWIFPIRLFVSCTLKFLPVLLLVIIGIALAGVPITPAYAFLPVVVAVQEVFIVGAVTLLSSIVPLFPDLRHIINNVQRLWLFLSGVFYDVSTLDERLQGVLAFNPMIPVLQAYRSVLLEGEAPSLQLVFPLAAGLALASLGILVLRRFDLLYPKMV